MLAPAGSCCVR
uniref:Uncharacterized protein n=1 Tax=Arundo donax TaxID=35708 RepID=A0A0A9CCI9_ARUDO